MSRLFTILTACGALALASCATADKEECDSCCDSPGKAKSGSCAEGAAAKPECASCDSHAKKK